MSSILAVGSVAYDSVKTPFGEVTEALGGSATYFSLSASFFTRVHLVACVGSDFRPEDVELLRSRDIDLTGLRVLKGRTFRWAGKYGYDLNDAETLETQLNVFAEFNPELSDSHRRVEYVFLGNIDPTLQGRVLSQVARPKLVACDTMNFWITGQREAVMETLSRVDVLLINDAEIRQLANESNLVKAARHVLESGPSLVVVKRGEYGVISFQKACGEGNGLTAFSVPGYPLEDVFDPTGAGDTFAGGFLGYLAHRGTLDPIALRRAIVYGSVMASFNVEEFSLNRLRRLTSEEVEERYQEFRRMTHFDALSD